MLYKNNKEDFQSYLSDAANVKGECVGIYFPENEAEIIELVKKANDEKFNLTVSAGRTGLNGGCVPQNGVIISTEKLNKTLKINIENKYAIVEPGVVLADFQKEVEKLNLFYPPDPTETNCFLGGTVINNSSGARTFKYGPTRNFVKEISVVLPNGEKVKIARNENFIHDYSGKINLNNGNEFEFTIPNYKMPNVKHAAGYYCKPEMDLIDLFIGSEGTLGIVTQIKLKLIDLPKNILSMIIFFNEENNLFDFIKKVRELSKDENNIIDLREIEFFDYKTLKILSEDYPNIPAETKGAVWIEQEFEDCEEENLLAEIDELIQKFNGDAENIWFALNEKERAKLKEFRHKIALKVNEIISARGLLKVGTDNAVPDDKFEEFYDFTKSLIMEHNLDYVVYGHIGNSHLHFNMLPKDKDELALCRKLYSEICAKSVELGGTVSAEHGIGKLKTKYLLEMFGEENILQMAKLKKTFDPNMILNIGNMFEEKYLKMV